MSCLRRRAAGGQQTTADGAITGFTYTPYVMIPVLDHTVRNIDGKPVKLRRYQGQVLLIVNVSSLCGNTPRYANQESFCSMECDVTFPVFSKVVVKGDGRATLRGYLTSKDTDPRFGGDIEWNSAKFIISRKGEVVARFQARANPEIVSVIEAQREARM